MGTVRAFSLCPFVRPREDFRGRGTHRESQRCGSERRGSRGLRQSTT
ncbi:hypothetical protein ACFPRL_33090 [Pseudoclavibacter helvolus]